MRYYGYTKLNVALNYRRARSDKLDNLKTSKAKRRVQPFTIECV